MSKAALLLIDIQNDYFEGGRWPVDKMQQVSANAARLLEHARKTDQAIFHVHHEFLTDDAPFFRPGTPGAEIHASVSPEEGERVILKHSPNGFQNTSLHEELEAQNITELVICGAMSQMCIDATTRAGADLGYRITVIEDACGAKEQSFNDKMVPAPMVHAAFMAPLSGTYAQVVTTETYLR
ncbi:MAG: cysteine hydrolase [Hyphomicrobiaceae bacterium]|nr:cysteine hydrolase [Hyphomicrobiaceae bacterium]